MELQRKLTKKWSKSHAKVMYINKNRQLEKKNVNKETINNPFL